MDLEGEAVSQSQGRTPEKTVDKQSKHGQRCLSRQMSAPTNLKPSSNKSVSIEDGIILLADRNGHYRTSQTEVRTDFSQDRNIHLVSRAKSCNGNTESQSSSSMTSDSAFSQSQSTLESDEGEPSSASFRRSLSERGCNLYTINKGLRSRKIAGPGCGNNENSNCQREQRQFKIVWRNLRYRVPKKRFTRLRESLNRYKEKLWYDNDQYDTDSQNINDPSRTTTPGSEHTTRVPSAGRPREVIFEDLNGYAESGRLTAILGPSGAGKTTLLKCLTNSVTKGVSGSIDVVDNESSIKRKRMKLCIIPQKGELTLDNCSLLDSTYPVH